MIKFVYFDIGGVAILDFSGTDKWKKMKKVMGVKKEFEKEFDDLYDKYEKEDLCLTRQVDSLMPVFAKKFGLEYPEGFLMSEYFVDHFEKNRSLWPVIKEIQKYCRIGLLTNMYVGMLKDIMDAGLLPEADWDVIIDSTKVGLQKPDPEVFKLSEKKSGVTSGEILFVENNLKNIEAAQKAGWKTYLYITKNPQEASRGLSEYFRKEMLK